MVDAESPNDLVYGYHGTTHLRANKIRSEGFLSSTFSGDWLGNAVYFWERDEMRAAEWAIVKANEEGAKPVVIRATIDLSRCFDLCAVRYKRILAAATKELESHLTPAELARITQTWGRRELDCTAINYYLDSQYDTSGERMYTTVRGAFQEGEPIFAIGDMRSGISTLDHVQIGVIDTSAIRDLQLLRVVTDE